MLTRHDHYRSLDPTAIQLAEEEAEERSRPSDEGDPYGWAASRAEDRETRWREGL